MSPGAAARGASGGGPAATYSTADAVELATIAAATGDDRHAVTYRQADYWCRAGVMGDALAETDGSGSRRRWTGEDVLVLAAVARVSHAWGQLAGRHAGSVVMYRHVAIQIRAGEREALAARLTDHVVLSVDIGDITTVLAAVGVTTSPCA